MTQLIEVFDADNQSLGYTKPKQDVERDGDWHRTAEIVVLNDRHEVLCSLRHPDKKVLPNYWDVCVGGHVDPGETYEQCALREVEEEIGIRPDAHALRFVGVVPVEVLDDQQSLRDREHAGVFVRRMTYSVNDFVMQADEVAGLRFLPLETVKQELLSDTPSLNYTPPRTAYYQMLCLAEGAYC